MLLPAALAAVTAMAVATGVRKLRKGRRSISDARRRGEIAQRLHAGAVANLEGSRAESQARAEEFANRKRALVVHALGPVLDFLETIQRHGRLTAFETLHGIDIRPQELDGFKAVLIDTCDAFKGLGAAALAGGGAAPIASAAAAFLGSASTGTAIGSLSGAAATNATLAWLGGGALAAGGGGMALGLVVLNGIGVGPAVLVAGFVLAARGEKALTQVREYERRVNEACAHCASLEATLGMMRNRMDEIESVAGSLAERLDVALQQLRLFANSEGDTEWVRSFHLMITLARALAEVLRAPILTPDGRLSSESSDVVMKYGPLLQ